MSPGFFDVHTHILPGLDHGAADWEEALAMARIAVTDGIGSLAATPHVSFEFQNGPANIRAAVAEFRERLAAAGIPLEVHVGADYQLVPELLTDLKRIITLGDNGRYFLLELPSMVVPPNLIDVLQRFIDGGKIPVITHPERNPQLSRQPHLLKAMAALGCPLQFTAGSLTGTFGPEVRESTARLLRDGHCHLLASDAHWVTERPPILSEGLRAAEELLGVAAARRLVVHNPEDILRGVPLAG